MIKTKGSLETDETYFIIPDNTKTITGKSNNDFIN